MNPVSSLTTSSLLLSSLFFTDPAPTEFYTLSLHDALPIFISLLDTTSPHRLAGAGGPTGGTFQIGWVPPGGAQQLTPRSEEHTSELQSRENLVCRLLLEKKKTKTKQRETVLIRHPSTSTTV